MIILGIDPGLRYTALGFIEIFDNRLQFMDAITIAPHPKESMPQRLYYLYNELHKNLDNIKIDIAVIEETFVSSNPQTSLKLGQARAMCLLAPTQHNINIMELSPRDIKKSVTGSGKADKKQVELMVKMLLPNVTAKNEHEMDALAMAIAGSHYYQTYQKRIIK